MISNIVNNLITKLPSIMLTNGAGRSVAIDTGPSSMSEFSIFIRQILVVIGNFFLNIGEFILRVLAKVAFFICKICLNFIDLFSIVIKNLSGQSTSYSISKNANLEESDILFKFLFNDFVLEILKDVLIFSLLLIIVFTILALIKNEWGNALGDNVSSYKKVLVKTVISLFSLLIVPFILIVGIIFSNVILASALSAISDQGGSYSLGAQIFTASSYEANQFRLYAQNGQKIPILFDYNGSIQNVDEFETPEIDSGSISASEESLKRLTEDKFTAGQSTYNMFANKLFYNFDEISSTSAYYDVYDGQYLKTNLIEYYVMADFVDFAMSSGYEFYVKNVESVYDQTILFLQQNKMPDIETEPEKHNAIHYVLDNIVPYDKDKKPIDFNDIKNGSKSPAYYNFKVYYDEDKLDALKITNFSIDENEESFINYESLAGATSEVTGAKYIYTTKYILNEEDGSFIYLPLSLNTKIGYYTYSSSFLKSAPEDEVGEELIRPETMFLARGVFTGAGYPTTIKQNGADIVYYRHEASKPNVTNFNQIYSYVNSDTKEDSGITLGDVTEFLTGIDISQLVPEIQIKLNLATVFNKTELQAASLIGGKFKLNYSFANSGVSFDNVFDSIKINYVVMIFACVMLFKTLIYVILGLVKRLYEITLLWITYPGWISKFPIEKGDNILRGTAFASWKKSMISKVLSLFGIYVGISLVFFLVPIVFEIDYISTFNIDSTNIFGILSSDVANFALKVIFVLVLFNIYSSSTEGGGIVELVAGLITLSRGGELIKSGKDTMGDIKGELNSLKQNYTIGGITKKVKGKALMTTRAALNTIPGRNIIDRVTDLRNIPFNKKIDNKLNSAENDLLSKTTEADIEASSDELTRMTNDHRFMENYRQARDDYWRNTGKGIFGKIDKDFRNRDEHYKDIANEGTGIKIKSGNKKIKERKHYKNIRKSRGI